MNPLDVLSDYEPRPECAERVRARCHAAMLARQQRVKAPSRPDSPRSWRFAFETALVAVVCAGYLVEVVRRAMVLYGL